MYLQIMPPPVPSQPADTLAAHILPPPGARQRIGPRALLLPTKARVVQRARHGGPAEEKGDKPLFEGGHEASVPHACVHTKIMSSNIPLSTFFQLLEFNGSLYPAIPRNSVGVLPKLRHETCGWLNLGHCLLLPDPEAGTKTKHPPSFTVTATSQWGRQRTQQYSINSHISGVIPKINIPYTQTPNGKWDARATTYVPQDRGNMIRSRAKSTPITPPQNCTTLTAEEVGWGSRMTHKHRRSLMGTRGYILLL